MPCLSSCHTSSVDPSPIIQHHTPTACRCTDPGEWPFVFLGSNRAILCFAGLDTGNCHTSRIQLCLPQPSRISLLKAFSRHPSDTPHKRVPAHRTLPPTHTYTHAGSMREVTYPSRLTMAGSTTGSHGRWTSRRSVTLARPVPRFTGSRELYHGD